MDEVVWFSIAISVTDEILGRKSPSYLSTWYYFLLSKLSLCRRIVAPLPIQQIVFENKIIGGAFVYFTLF